jgi:hypothetical protein
MSLGQSHHVGVSVEGSNQHRAGWIESTYVGSNNRIGRIAEEAGVAIHRPKPQQIMFDRGCRHGSSFCGQEGAAVDRNGPSASELWHSVSAAPARILPAR